MPASPDEARLSRLHELRFWLRGLGCCWLCSLRLALAQVEKEAGLKFEAGAQCAGDGNCTTKAREGWGTLPRLATAPATRAA
jgi:hypothetical protein